jgi:hypothetical protein
MSECIFYFGCIRQPGHYLWLTEHNHVYNTIPLGISERLGYALDGAFCPIDMNAQQQWLCSSVPPWTIVAWWDRSVDSRPNCVSAFIGKGFEGEPNRLLEEAKKLFPSVFERQPQELSEYQQKDSK